MKILAIDPGPEQSGVMLYDGHTNTPSDVHGVLSNLVIEDAVELFRDADSVAIEMIASYGMPVGRDVFETCLWIGRFIGVCRVVGRPYQLIYRKDVKLHLCGSPRAKDSNIRQALIYRFGPGKEKAIGLKKTTGPLYGVKSHVWAALAVAVTHLDTSTEQKDGA